MTRGSVHSRLVAATLTVTIGSLLVLVSLAPAARAELGIQPGSFNVTTSTNQAGAHPDLTTSFAFTTDSANLLTGHPRNITVDLPPGFSGTPPAVARCPVEQFSALPAGFHPQTCPRDSQVGTANVLVTGNGQVFNILVPVYNLAPNQGETAKLGLSVLLFKIQAVISVRPGDHGIRTEVRNVDGTLGDLDSSSITLWGVPADPSHDAQRGLLCNNGNCAFCDQTGCGEGRGPSSAGTPLLPFLRNPTECTGAPASATLSVTSWENPSQAQTATSSVEPMTGCERLGFDRRSRCGRP